MLLRGRHESNSYLFFRNPVFNGHLHCKEVVKRWSIFLLGHHVDDPDFFDVETQRRRVGEANFGFLLLASAFEEVSSSSDEEEDQGRLIFEFEAEADGEPRLCV